MSRSSIATIVVSLALLTSACWIDSSDVDHETSGHQIPKTNIVSVLQFTDDGSDDYVTSLAVTEEALWVGTERSVYEVRYSFDPPELSVVQRHEDAVSEAEVNSLRIDGHDVLVASTQGFARYSAGAWSRHDVGNINDVLRVGNDLWAATNNGLEILRGGSREWLPLEVTSITDHFPTRKMLSMETDNTSTVWVGSEFGLHRFDLAAHANIRQRMDAVSTGALQSGEIDIGNLWTRLYGAYQNPSGGLITTIEGNSHLEGNRIERIRWDDQSNRFAFCTERSVTLLQDSRWTSYSGTTEILALSPSGELTRRSSTGNVGIPTGEVYDVVFSGSDLWLATRSGLALVKEDRTANLFTIADGLPSNGIRALDRLPGSNYLFAGTDHGIALVRVR